MQQIYMGCYFERQKSILSPVHFKKNESGMNLGVNKKSMDNQY